MGYEAIFDTDRTFGIDMEVYGPPRQYIQDVLEDSHIPVIQREYGKFVTPTWRLTDDRSIYGQNPTEVVSPILKGLEGLAEVENVCTVLDKAGCMVNWSCGFHVHWSVQDYTGKNILSLLRLYAKFENVIDFLVSPSRRRNQNKHCQSLVKDDDLTWIAELDRTERKRAVDVAYAFSDKFTEWTVNPQTNRSEPRSSRYHKVNISAYNNYGTVEFRHHQGTVNKTKAINWIVFTQQLVNKAKQVAISREPSAKPTLGEMLRVLRLTDHQLIEDRCTDPLVIHLGDYLKDRYQRWF